MAFISEIVFLTLYGIYGKEVIFTSISYSHDDRHVFV